MVHPVLNYTFQINKIDLPYNITNHVIGILVNKIFSE